MPIITIWYNQIFNTNIFQLSSQYNSLINQLHSKKQTFFKRIECFLSIYQQYLIVSQKNQVIQLTEDVSYPPFLYLIFLKIAFDLFSIFMNQKGLPINNKKIILNSLFSICRLNTDYIIHLLSYYAKQHHIVLFFNIIIFFSYFILFL